MEVARVLVVFILCVTAALCRPPRRSRRDLNMINPDHSEISIYNFTVAVLNHNYLLGGGVLIGKQFVMTAAFNTDGFEPADLRVRVGSTTANSGGKVCQVVRITQHPNYTADWTSDLALLRLAAPVPSSVAVPVQVARAPWSSVSGDQHLARVFGFGATQEMACQTGDRGVGGFQLAKIQVYNHTECNAQWYGHEIVEGELCAYSSNTGPCWGDFGDPIVVSDSLEATFTLVACFAGSYGCADDKYPGIYTDVGYFHSWIEENTGA